MNIAFLYNEVSYGRHRAALNWLDLDAGPSGLTGSDLVVVSYAREFARRGHEVTLYCHNAEHGSSYDGVQVVPYSVWPSVADDGGFDVAISLSNPNPLRHAGPSTLRVTNRQVSLFGIDVDPEFASYTDLITCPSQWAVDLVSAPLDPATRAKFRVQPNGCYPDQTLSTSALQIPPKVAGQVAYVSSPDRGLHLLLSRWPEIRRRVPGATLRVAYQGLQNWVDFHADPGKRMHGAIDEECSRRAMYVRNALRRLAAHGVEVMGGGMSHRDVTRLLAESEVLAFPASLLAPTETFSVATLEAAAAGAVPVISDADCLPEVHGGAAIVVRDVEHHLDEWTDRVVDVLTNPELAESMRKLGREHAAAHAWPLLTERYEALLVDVLERKRNPGSGVSAGSDSHPVTSSEPIRIDLVLTQYGSGEGPIDVAHPFDSKGAGGCPAGFMGLVRALPALGYRVRAFGNFTGAESWRAFHDGVEHRPIADFAAKSDRDVALAYYDTSPLVGVTGCLRVASHHTFCLPFPGAVEWTDLNTAPSQYAVDALRTVYDASSPWYVMPNGLPLETLPEWRPAPGRVLYHASPSRGLEHLLGAWEEIVRCVPTATLHVVGDVDGWLRHYAGKRDRQALKAERVREALVGLEGGDYGVSFLGRLPRAAVLREIQEASCFCFPFEAVAPCEVWSISIQECLAVGVPVVLRARDALESLWGPHVSLIDDRPETLVNAVTQVLTHPQEFEARAAVAKEYARSYTFARKAAALDAAIRKELGGRRGTSEAVLAVRDGWA